MPPVNAADGEMIDMYKKSHQKRCRDGFLAFIADDVSPFANGPLLDSPEEGEEFTMIQLETKVMICNDNDDEIQEPEEETKLFHRATKKRKCPGYKAPLSCPVTHGDSKPRWMTEVNSSPPCHQLGMNKLAKVDWKYYTSGSKSSDW